MKKLPAMLVVVLGVASLFADDYKVFDHGHTWSLEKKTMTVSGESIARWTITGCTPLPEGEFTVPAKIGNISVWGVADKAFSGATNVTSVTVEPGIKRIGYAFYTADADKNVLPSNIEKVSLPAGIEYLDCDAFQNSKIEREQASKGLVVDGYFIKYKGTDETYTIPAGVKHICVTAFYRANTNSHVCVLKNIVIPEGVETIQDSAFDHLERDPFEFGDVVLPDSLKSIGKDAFKNVSFKSLKLGTGTTDLSKVGVDIDGKNVAFKGAFNKATIESLDFGDGVESIPNNLFMMDSALKSVKFGSALRAIGSAAFNRSSVTNFDFSAAAKLEKIGQQAFSMSKVVKVDLSACTKLKEIPTRCFFGCNALREVTFNEGLETIRYAAFDSYDAYDGSAEGLGVLGSLTFPKSLKTIEDRAFYGSTNLSEVVLNDGLEEIGSEAFGTEVHYDGPWGEFIANSRLTKVDIPASVTTLGGNVFNACSNLWEITGGAGVDQFSGAFGELVPAFASVEKDASGKELPFRVLTFGKTAVGFQGKCPSELTAAQFGDITVIGPSAFAGWRDNMSISNLVKVVVPETIRAIGPSAFAANENLKTLDLSAASPELVIGSQAFYGTAIEELEGVVSSIGGEAFADCKNLKEVDIAVEPIVETDEDDPEWVGHYYGYVEDGAFSGCTSLTNASIFIAACVEREWDGDDWGVIGEEAFKNCANLKAVNIAARYLGDDIFSGCCAIEKATINARDIPMGFLYESENLGSLTLGDRVETIGEAAFASCGSLKTLDLPESVTHLGAAAFGLCTNLSEVTGGEGLVRVDELAFYWTKYWDNAPKGATLLGSMLIKWTDDKDGETAEIPAGVEYIASTAFFSNSVKKVIVPESIALIRQLTFVFCQDLEQVEFKNREIRLTTYPESWHYDCPVLEARGENALVVPNKGAYILAGWSSGSADDEFGEYYEYVTPDYEKLAFHNDEAEDGAFVPGSSYTGWIMSGNYVVGTVSVKTGKPDRNSEVKVTMTVQLAGVKKNFTAMFKVDENGKAVATEAARKMFSELAGNPDFGRYAGVFLGGTWLSGGVRLAGRDYTVRGANSGKEALAGMDAFANHTWGAVLTSSSDLVPAVNGYSGLSIAVAKNGKVKISGTLADGQKVSVTAQMAAGDNGVFAAPVYVQTNGKKGGFGFVIDFYMDGESPRAWFEKCDDGVGYMTNWQYPLEFGVHNADSDASTFTSVGLNPVGSRELFEIDPKGNGLEEGFYFVRWDPNGYPVDSSAEAEHALNVSSKSPFVVIEQDSSFFDSYVDLMVDAKGKWTLPKATKVSLATEKDLEKYAEEISRAYVWTDEDERPHCTVVTSDGKILEAYDFYRDEILRTYAPTAFLICDIGSKVGKDGNLVMGGNTNFYDMKLSYAKKTGLVKGSSVYYWVDISKAGKPALKKGKAAISGVVLDGRIYGASTVKKVASIALASEKVD